MNIFVAITIYSFYFILYVFNSGRVVLQKCQVIIALVILEVPLETQFLEFLKGGGG